MAIPTRPAGWPWWSLALGLGLLIGLAWGLIYLGHHWDPVHAVLSWLGRPRQPHVVEVATPASFEPASDGHRVPSLPVRDDAWKPEQERLRKLLALQDEQNKKILAELEALKHRKSEKSASSTEVKEKKPPTLTRAPGIKLRFEPLPPTSGKPTYVLAPGSSKLACQVEMAMNSDVGHSYFTCRITRPIFDSATGQHKLIDQNDTILARDEGANITVGNELLPAFATTLSRRDGPSVDLGHVPVTDAIGINGLASRINHHYIRNLLAGFMLGTLRAGRQVVQQEVASEAGVVLGSPVRVLERPLSRAIDSRPTIEVDPGELANVVLLQPLSLTAVE